MKTKTPAKAPAAADQLETFIDRYSPEVAALGRAVLKKFRTLIPPSIEMVYDNYNFLVVGFVPNERPSDAIFSVVFGTQRVSICFIQGVKLADPDKLLLGGGNQVRTLRLPSVKTLDDPKVRSLIARALETSPVPYGQVGRRQLVIKSISAKQRPRRPA